MNFREALAAASTAANIEGVERGAQATAVLILAHLLQQIPGLPVPTMLARPDGAVSFRFGGPYNSMTIWARGLRHAKLTSWEAKEDGRRLAQGYYRDERRESDLPRITCTVLIVL